MSTIFKIKRLIKQQRFWRPQTYHVSFQCTLPTTTGYTLLALPMSASYQKHKNISLSPALGHQLYQLGLNDCYVIANELHSVSQRILLEYIVTVQPRIPQVPITSKVKQAYEETLSELTYGNPIRGLYTAEQSLEKRCVDCGGFSSLLQSKLATVGIPSRIVAGFWAGYSDSTMHAWLEYEHSENMWLPLDASTDFLGRQGRTYKTGGCGYVGSDRIVVSTGSHHQFSYKSVEAEIDILQTPLVIQLDGTIKYIDDYSFTTKRV